MVFSCLLSVLILISLFLLAFFFLSKSFSWDLLVSSVFECGYSSWFFSRFSFSIHYFLVGLIFLFLDLELCLTFPLLSSCLSSVVVNTNFFILVFALVVGLLIEWFDSKLDWTY